jgi:hypothetical protein
MFDVEENGVNGKGFEQVLFSSFGSLGDWNLVLVWCLVLVIWNFNLTIALIFLLLRTSNFAQRTFLILSHSSLPDGS